MPAAPSFGARRGSAAWRLVVALLAIALLSLGPVRAESPAPEATGIDPRGLCAPGTVIGSIEVERVNVFDTTLPGEDGWVYRSANWVHSINLTREARVRSLLIVRPGDPCRVEKLAEAERELRNLPFLSDAWVEVVAREGNQVRLRVRTRDSWSTRLGASIGVVGGSERASARIVERNVLGTGTGIAYRWQKNIDRTLSSFELYVPSLTRQRWQIDGLYSRNSDGYEKTFSLARPFYSLDTRWSASLFSDQLLEEQKVYSFGEEVDLWRQDYSTSRVRYAWAQRRSPGGGVVRWTGGVRRLQQFWERAEPNKPVTVPESPPVDVDALLLDVGLEWIVPRFYRARYYDTGRRVEDIDLSTAVTVFVGRSIQGASPGRAFELEAVGRTGFKLGSDSSLLVNLAQTLRMSEGDWYDAITVFGAQYYGKSSALWTTYVAFSAQYGNDLPVTSQFLLGADTGLRGYASRQFDGDRTLLLQAEERLFLSREWLRLVRVAFVGFVDVGVAWDSGYSLSWSDLRPDAGLGIRVSLLRGSKGAGMVAYAGYPLNRRGLPPDDDGWQFSVYTVTGF